MCELHGDTGPERDALDQWFVWLFVGWRGRVAGRRELVWLGSDRDATEHLDEIGTGQFVFTSRLCDLHGVMHSGGGLLNVTHN